MFKPINKKVLLIRLVGKSKRVKGSSLIVPEQYRKKTGGDFSRMQECWIVSWADDCKVIHDEKLHAGSRIFITDGFVTSMKDEVDSLIDFPEMLAKEEFASLKEEIEEWGASPFGFLMHEEMIAVVRDN